VSSSSRCPRYERSMEGQSRYDAPGHGRRRGETNPVCRPLNLRGAFGRADDRLPVTQLGASWCDGLAAPDVVSCQWLSPVSQGMAIMRRGQREGRLQSGSPGSVRPAVTPHPQRPLGNAGQRRASCCVSPAIQHGADSWSVVGSSAFLFKPENCCLGVLADPWTKPF
jgi:hypothetical protein